MGGDHKCPVCGSTFTRSQHVARHMRSHTGDRPYKCVHCGDQFARSDLLSRHVNKCHSSEKKAPLSSNGANAANANATSSTLNGRRKPRQMSTSSQPASSTSYTHPNPNGIAIGATGDPFTNIYQPSPHTSQSPSHRYPSSDGIDPPSLSSSLASSSSASASLDSLPHEPVFHVPQQVHYQFGRPSTTTAQWGLHSYPNYLPPFDGSSADGASMYKPNDHFTATSTTTVPQYHDLPTPLAYAGAQGPQPHPMSSMNPMDPFMSSQSMPTLSNGQLDTSLYNTSRAAPNLPRGEGGFSSAFGLMSLDDPSVLAGISNDGMPFFNGPAIPDLHGLLPTGMTPIGMHNANANANPGANSTTNATTSNGAGTNGLYGNTSGTAPDVQTPNSKEQLKELWAAFLRDPTTGIKADGTEMGRPEFPIVSPGANANANSQPSPQQQQQTQPQPPQQQSQQQQPQQPPYLHLHRRSSSYSGTGANSISNFAKNGIKLESSPYNMPTAKYGGANVVKKLEDQASRVSPDSATNATGAAPAVAHIGTAESLRSYEEAILSRKAPVLKLPNKLKGREGTGSGASSVLPSLSNAGRGGISMSGGGVTSLMSRDLATATAAGASSVPFGSTPFQQQLHQSQQMAGVAYGDRPVINMPRPRSRHGTSSQNSSRPGTSSGPPSAATGGPGAANAGPNSQPGSRPGTASSQGHGQSQSQSPPSVPLYQSHSTPNSRPSTSNGPSPYVFAYNPPPLVAQPGYPNYGLSPTSMKTGGQGIPPEPSPSPTTAQQLVSAVSSTSDLGSVVTNRPSYKRLASSALEPSSTKRPHLRRGDTNFNPNPENPNSSNPNLTTPYNDGNDGFESEGLSDVERSSVHSFGSERSWHGPHTAHMGSMNRPWGGGNPGHGHHSASPFNGQGGPGGYNPGMSSAQMRRMSEPAVAAPRMAMRAPPPMPHQQHQMQQQAQMAQVPIHPQMQMPVQMQAAQAGNGQA